MALIPKDVYSLIERKRRGRWTMEAQAKLRLQEAEAAAHSMPSPGSGGAGGKSGPGDRTGRTALSIAAAEEKLQNAMAWESVWQLMDKVFPFGRTSEGTVAGYLYDNGMTWKEISQACKCSVKAVEHARDNWVCHAALIAAGDGLILIRKGETEA